jgi:hypothetical protein
MISTGYLVELVAEIAREEDPTADPRWEALAAGSLPARARADLRAMAQRSAVARALWDACQPLPAERLAQLVDRIVERLAQGAGDPCRAGC